MLKPSEATATTIDSIPGTGWRSHISYSISPTATLYSALSWTLSINRVHYATTEALNAATSVSAGERDVSTNTHTLDTGFDGVKVQHTKVQNTEVHSPGRVSIQISERWWRTEVCERSNQSLNIETVPQTPPTIRQYQHIVSRTAKTPWV